MKRIDPHQQGKSTVGRAGGSRRARWATRGFSMVETLVVLVVIGVIASIAIKSYRGADHRARQRATMADMRIIARAIETYATDNNSLPGDDAGLEGLVEVIVPYASNVLPLRDHWGTPYRYATDLIGNYTIESYGRDGVDGADYAANQQLHFENDLVLRNGVFISAPD
jgi:general secretion pathway protein G